jgi:IclR family transcriptional regulator, acetate operon repressor
MFELDGVIAEKTTWLRALRILETVAGSPHPLSLERIAALTDLPKATAHRLLQELASSGFVLREPEPKVYGVGPRLTTLGLDSLLNATWRTERRAILERLVDEIGETCNFTMLDATVVRYIERVEADWPLRLVLRNRVPPCHFTAPPAASCS